MKRCTRPDIYQKVWEDDSCNILGNACRYSTFLMISDWLPDDNDLWGSSGSRKIKMFNIRFSAFNFNFSEVIYS